MKTHGKTRKLRTPGEEGGSLASVKRGQSGVHEWSCARLECGKTGHRPRTDVAECDVCRGNDAALGNKEAAGNLLLGVERVMQVASRRQPVKGYVALRNKVVCIRLSRGSGDRHILFFFTLARRTWVRAMILLLATCLIDRMIANSLTHQ